MDPLSNLCGLASIACWLGAQFPQVRENIRRQSCDGIALPFLANWLLGDLSNLVGCLLTQQLPFQTCLASYFVAVDGVLVAQFIYYSRPALPGPSPVAHYRTMSAISAVSSASTRHRSVSIPDDADPGLRPRRVGWSRATSGASQHTTRFPSAPRPHSQDPPPSSCPSRRTAAVCFLGLTLLCGLATLFATVRTTGLHALPLRFHMTQDSSQHIVGRFFAWLCTSLYLTSRIPQIWKNYTRKSVQGLSMFLFVFAFLGNSFYVSSILLSSKISSQPAPEARAFIFESFPYLLGSAGTLLFDITIVAQSFLYRPAPAHPHAPFHPFTYDEDAALLAADALAARRYTGTNVLLSQAPSTAAAKTEMGVRPEDVFAARGRAVRAPVL